jgi:hypothetical protein
MKVYVLANENSGVAAQVKGPSALGQSLLTAGLSVWPPQRPSWSGSICRAKHSSRPIMQFSTAGCDARCCRKMTSMARLITTGGGRVSLSRNVYETELNKPLAWAVSCSFCISGFFGLTK